MSLILYVLQLSVLRSYLFFFFFLMIPRPPISTLFPYTTLFRSSYFYGTKNAASQSYGVESFMTSDDLVINNIFQQDRKSTRLNSSHRCISYAVFCLKKKKKKNKKYTTLNKLCHHTSTIKPNIIL